MTLGGLPAAMRPARRYHLISFGAGKKLLFFFFFFKVRQLNCLDGLWEHLDRKNTLLNQKAFNHHKSYLGESFPAEEPAVAAIDHVTSEEGYCVRHVGSWALCCQEADDALCQRRAYQIQDGGFTGNGREEMNYWIIKSFGKHFHPEPLTVMETACFWATRGQEGVWL